MSEKTENVKEIIDEKICYDCEKILNQEEKGEGGEDKNMQTLIAADVEKQYKYNNDLQIYLNSLMSYIKEVSFTEMLKVFFIKEEEEKYARSKF